VKNVALEHGIAPYTVCKQLEAYAKHTGRKVIVLGPAVHKVAASLNHANPLMSEHILRSQKESDVETYLHASARFFETPFFEALGAYLRTGAQGAGYVETVMDIPFLDARSIFDRLT
jgi:hypothetical protein